MMVTNGVPNGNGAPFSPTLPMDNIGMVDVRYSSDANLLGRSAEDDSQDLEGLDLSNIAGWDLDTFWNF